MAVRYANAANAAGQYRETGNLLKKRLFDNQFDRTHNKKSIPAKMIGETVLGAGKTQALRMILPVPVHPNRLQHHFARSAHHKRRGRAR